MTKILEIYQTIGFFNLLWIICLLLILMASFRTWGDDNIWIFGFFIFYILFYPIYKRWDRYINEITINWPNFESCVFIIILLSFFWIILFLKLLPNIVYFLVKKNLISDWLVDNKIMKFLIEPHINEKSKIKQWLNNFSKIWLSWVNIVGYVPGIEFLLDFLVKNLPVYLNTKAKILWFFGLTLYLPRFLTLFALFYDIYIKKELYWFPLVALLLTISVIIKMCLTFAKEGSRMNLEYINSMIWWEYRQKEKLSEQIQEEIKENFPESVRLANFKLKKEFEDKINRDFLFSEYILHSTLIRWSSITDVLLSTVFGTILLFFITSQLATQIIILLKYL